MIARIPPGILEVLDRANSGPICTDKEWNTKVIPKGIAEKLKEHGLSKTCDPNNPVNTDDGLADEFYRAGFEFAVETGILCQDTRRIIKLSEEELKLALKASPSELHLGVGLDGVTMRARKPEDKTIPIFGAPLGIVVSEDLYIPAMLGVAQCREIDVLRGFSLETVYGRPAMTGTPYETLVGNLQAQMHREILRRSCRPGMPAEAVISSTTDYGQFGGYGIVGGYKPTDMACVLSPSELKTNYTSLQKVVHAVNCGGRVLSGSWAMIGGYSGPPEGSVVSSIAYTILIRPIQQAIIAGTGAFDFRYLGNCGREALWANSVFHQGVSRNTHTLVHSLVNQTAGPCTDMLLHESVVGMMSVSVSGDSYSVGPRSASGKYTNYVSPLEARFCAEVHKKCAGLKRSDANEIAKSIIPKYDDRLMNPLRGKKFTECFDLKTLKPTKEWHEICDKVKKEIIDLGIPLELP